MEVKVDLIALVFFGLQRGKVGGFTLLAAVGVRGAGDGAIDADANFFPFSSSTGTILIFCKKADDICTVFIMVCVTDGSTENFLLTSSGSMPFSSATRDK